MSEAEIWQRIARLQEDVDTLGKNCAMLLMAINYRDEAHKEFCKLIGKFVGEQVNPLKKQIAELEAGGIKYCGVYQRAIQYRRGDVVTYDGSMFCAVGNPPLGESPNQGLNWQLAAKRGRDGRDRAA
jgi:hypothetical protein